MMDEDMSPSDKQQSKLKPEPDEEIQASPEDAIDVSDGMPA